MHSFTLYLFLSLLYFCARVLFSLDLQLPLNVITHTFFGMLSVTVYVCVLIDGWGWERCVGKEKQKAFRMAIIDSQHLNKLQNVCCIVKCVWLYVCVYVCAVSCFFIIYFGNFFVCHCCTSHMLFIFRFKSRWIFERARLELSFCCCTIAPITMMLKVLK